LSAGGDFQAFFQATAPPLLAYLRRLGATADTAEDIAQDALEALVARGGLGWDDAKARGYLYRCATNGFIDTCRRRHVAWDDIDVADIPVAHDADPASLLASPAWHALTTRQRQLLWLAYAEEFSHREIAAICGLREASVRVLLHRAREAFRTDTRSPE
jgi:RNA polymerase sigma-70 factor (ECF subfamily)